MIVALPETLNLYQIPYPLTDTAALDTFLASPEEADYGVDKKLHLWIDRQDEGTLLPNFLNEEEKIRVEKFKVAAKGLYFSYSRSLLRLILSRYMGIHPRDIEFEYSINGKPILAAHQNQKGIHFNVSHSNGYFACLVGDNSQVGVDIEHTIPNDSQVDNISKSFFSPKEADAIASAGKPGAYFLFYKYWTIKEAAVKAEGLSIMQIKESPDLSHLPVDEVAVLTPFFLGEKSGFTIWLEANAYLAAIWCNNKYPGL